MDNASLIDIYIASVDNAFKILYADRVFHNHFVSLFILDCKLTYFLWEIQTYHLAFSYKAILSKSNSLIKNCVSKVSNYFLCLHSLIYSLHYYLEGNSISSLSISQSLNLNFQRSSINCNIDNPRSFIVSAVHSFCLDTSISLYEPL